MRKFGLVGKNISYSFSKKYFTEKFQNLGLENHSYEIFDIQDISYIDKVFEIKGLVGFNVTIPYKEKIISYLDDLSEEAQKIGAVNTILIKKGKKIGYNTDVFGFEKTLLLHKNPSQNSAMILGNGGAAKAVKFILEKHKIPYMVVSRKSEINFENIDNQMVKNHKIIIQTTPVGTFPNVEDCLGFPFEAIDNEHLIIDLIYNPETTTFMKNAQKNGAKAVNGYLMLEQQAEKAWEIWNFE